MKRSNSGLNFPQNNQKIDYKRTINEPMTSNHENSLKIDVGLQKELPIFVKRCIGRPRQRLTYFQGQKNPQTKDKQHTQIKGQSQLTKEVRCWSSQIPMEEIKRRENGACIQSNSRKKEQIFSFGRQLPFSFNGSGSSRPPHFNLLSFFLLFIFSFYFLNFI